MTNIQLPVTNKEEITLSAEVTITFFIEDICYLSDLDEDDIENHFIELVEERIATEDYDLNFEGEEAGVY